VTIEHAIDDVLARLSDAQVEALAAECALHQRPSGNLTQVAAGASPGALDALAALTKAWASQPTLTGDGVALALRVGLRARRDADQRRSRPVWTGPGAAGDQRLTAAVLHELVAHARERILLVCFAAYTLPELAADLEDAIQRGCQVDLVFETEEDSAGGYTTSHGKPFGTITGARRWRWPATHRTPGAVLHAKLLIVDGRRALVGSANLTHRALTANLEAGILIEDHNLAAELEAHIQSLIGASTLIDADQTA